MKTKRTLVSLAVFLSVFCLSIIFNLPGKILIPWFSANKAEHPIASPNNLSEATREPSVVTTADNLPLSKESYKLEEEKDYEQLISDNQVIGINEDSTQSESNESDLTVNRAETEEESFTTSSLGTSGPSKIEAKYANIGIAVANTYVNIREEASTDSDILGKLYKNAAAEILENDGDWYLIESGSVKGYVSSDYIKTGIPDNELITKYAQLSIQVTVDGLNVRKEPDTESDRITVIYKNEIYPVIKLQEDWIEIEITDEEETGYISSDHADLITKFENAISKEEEQELARLALEKEQKIQQQAKEKEQKRKQEEERVKKETEIKQREETSYSDEDLKLLACLVHAEAGSQSYEGKLAVANVVLNRVKSSKYPNTIKNVIYQRGQFSVASSGSLKKQLNNYSNYKSNSQLLSIKAAKAALEGDNNIGNRLYFNSYKAAVAKGYDKKTNSVKLENHLFW
ncbi:MAG: SH3 domain-containing protein [Clostridiales bacterium]|nr:SH3 domain-containing protein [Clostridiales bacterium]